MDSVAVDGYDPSTPTKNLGTALVESQWIEDQVQLWLSKMTRHISEAEASQKIIAGAQTSGITERAIKSSVIVEKQRVFLLVNSRSTIAPSFLSSYLQPVVESCRHVIGSHAPIIGWAETAQLEEHDITFTFDIEAPCPSIRVWPGVGGLCLFDVVERAIRCFYSPQPDLVEFLVRLLHLVLSTQLTQYGGSFFEVTWACPLVFNAQANWPICIWMCWTPTCGRVQVVLSSVSSGTLTTLLGSWIRGRPQSTSCSVC